MAVPAVAMHDDASLVVVGLHSCFVTFFFQFLLDEVSILLTSMCCVRIAEKLEELAAVSKNTLGCIKVCAERK